jgi:hypothetical protein
MDDINRGSDGLLTGFARCSKKATRFDEEAPERWRRNEIVFSRSGAAMLTLIIWAALAQSNPPARAELTTTEIAVDLNYRPKTGDHAIVAMFFRPTPGVTAKPEGKLPAFPAMGFADLEDYLWLHKTFFHFKETETTQHQMKPTSLAVGTGVLVVDAFDILLESEGDKHLIPTVLFRVEEGEHKGKTFVGSRDDVTRLLSTPSQKAASKARKTATGSPR